VQVSYFLTGDLEFLLRSPPQPSALNEALGIVSEQFFGSDFQTSSDWTRVQVLFNFFLCRVSLGDSALYWAFLLVTGYDRSLYNNVQLHIELIDTALGLLGALGSPTLVAIVA